MAVDDFRKQFQYEVDHPFPVTTRIAHVGEMLAFGDVASSFALRALTFAIADT